MGARTGAEFLVGLRDRRRELWLGGGKVDDITGHPQLQAGALTLASVFDRQHEYAADCLVPNPETGEPMAISHMIPRSVDDLRRRRRGLERIAEATVGLMGRTPDYMNVTFAGFAADPTFWCGPDRRNERGWCNLVAYQQLIAGDDLSLTHTIVHPTIDRATDRNFTGGGIPLHKVGDTPNGIVVRGARILATLAPYADEIAVYPGTPQPPGTDPGYCLSFAVPADAPGMTYLCRDTVATVGTNAFDHPLSSRFDEQDAYVIFDDVEVPRERVFIDGDMDVYNTVMGPSAWWPNIMQQTTTRALVKLEFAYGLACRLAEAVNDTQPGTIDMLGELASYVDVTRTAIDHAEDRAYERGDGAWFPDGRPLHPMRSLLTTWFPRVREIIVMIGSHNLLATPSRAMLDNESLRPLIDEMLPGALGMSAEDRSALHRLAWDFVGSGMSGRNDLYERNYLGSGKLNRGHLHSVYHIDRSREFGLVEAMLHVGRTI